MYLLNSALKHCKSEVMVSYPVDGCYFGQCKVYPNGSIWKTMVKTLNVTLKERQSLCPLLLFY